MRISALGAAAPEGSGTVPPRDASWLWANSGPTRIARRIYRTGRPVGKVYHEPLRWSGLSAGNDGCRAGVSFDSGSKAYPLDSWPLPVRSLARSLLHHGSVLIAAPPAPADR